MHEPPRAAISQPSGPPHPDPLVEALETAPHGVHIERRTGGVLRARHPTHLGIDRLRPVEARHTQRATPGNPHLLKLHRGLDQPRPRGSASCRDPPPIPLQHLAHRQVWRHQAIEVLPIHRARHCFSAALHLPPVRFEDKPRTGARGQLDPGVCVLNAFVIGAYPVGLPLDDRHLLLIPELGGRLRCLLQPRVLRRLELEEQRLRLGLDHLRRRIHRRGEMLVHELDQLLGVARVGGVALLDELLSARLPRRRPVDALVLVPVLVPAGHEVAHALPEVGEVHELRLGVHPRPVDVLGRPAGRATALQAEVVVLAAGVLAEAALQCPLSRHELGELRPGVLGRLLHPDPVVGVGLRLGSGHQRQRV